MDEGPGTRGHIHGVLKQVHMAAIKAGRPVRLVAATKGVWDERLGHAVEAGVTEFGENYVQDFIRKAQSMDYLPVTWHFIGRLQRNKVRYVVGLADLIHSVDSLELAEHIQRVCVKRGCEQKILLQVNVDEDPNKGGVAPDEVLLLAAQLRECHKVSVKGLMVLPSQTDMAVRRESFRRSHEMYRELQELLGPQVDTLSMGMSEDWREAVEEGSNLVRLGSVLFGERVALPH